MARTKAVDVVEQIRDKNLGEKNPGAPGPALYIPTGSTLLNLALSDRVNGGYAVGKIVRLIGNSSSGKTIAALSCLAEASRVSRCDDYRLIFDDAEAANEFNLPKLFGKALAARIEPARRDPDTGDPMPSETIEDWQYNTMKALKREEPFISIVDSWDAISSEEEQGKSAEMIAAKDKGKETSGTYAMGKAKMASQTLRMVVQKLKVSASLILIISQTRDNVDSAGGPFKAKHTTSGGRALQFYSTHTIWLTAGEKIRSRGRVIGVNCIAKVDKNKLTGKSRTVTFPIYYDYGIDDIGSCVDFMVEEKYWPANSKGLITATELTDVPLKRDALIAYIETEGKESVMKQAVKAAWLEIEESLKLNRKPKYG